MRLPRKGEFDGEDGEYDLRSKEGCAEGVGLDDPVLDVVQDVHHYFRHLHDHYHCDHTKYYNDYLQVPGAITDYTAINRRRRCR